MRICTWELYTYIVKGEGNGVGISICMLNKNICDLYKGFGGKDFMLMVGAVMSFTAHK